MCMLHYNQLLQCSLFTPHMESGLCPLLIYYKLCLYHDTKYIIYGVMNLPLSLHFPHSLSISPAPSPFVVLILCRASYTYWRVAVAIISSSLFIAILHTSELCSRKLHAISFATSSYNVIKQCFSILLCSRLLSRVLLVNYNTLYMYIQTYILHIHCVYGVYASKRLDLLF